MLQDCVQNVAGNCGGHGTLHSQPQIGICPCHHSRGTKRAVGRGTQGYRDGWHYYDSMQVYCGVSMPLHGPCTAYFSLTAQLQWQTLHYNSTHHLHVLLPSVHVHVQTALTTPSSGWIFVVSYSPHIQRGLVALPS